MKALVTGGAGFIGSTLVDRLLAEGHHVDVVDDLSSGSLANLAGARADHSHGVTFHQLDVRVAAVVDLLARRRPEIVFHLAGRADAASTVGAGVADIVGAVNVLEGARAAGAEKVVFASTAAIYGSADPDELPLKESRALRPVAGNGVAACAVEGYLRAYRELHDLEYTALALANVYGPRQRGGVVAQFAARLLAGDGGTITGDGEQSRDFVYVDDVVDAIVRAATRGGGLLLNIGTGVETSINALHAAMAGAAGVTAPAARQPARADELGRIALHAGRARIHLGWKPWTTLDAGLPEVFRAFRQG